MNTEAIRVLNSIKNSSLSNNELLKVKKNKLVSQIIELLYREGFILSFKFSKEKFSSVVINLRYSFNRPLFKDLKIISSPSNLRYVSYKDIARLNIRKKLAVFSTSKGVMSFEECKSRKTGGILLFVC